MRTVLVAGQASGCKLGLVSRVQAQDDLAVVINVYFVACSEKTRHLQQHDLGSEWIRSRYKD